MSDKKQSTENQVAKLDNFSNIGEMTLWANTIINSGFLPDSISTPEEVITIVQHGRELGLTPHIALNNINVIQGRPTVSSTMLGSLMKGRGIEWVWKEDFITVKDDSGSVQKTPAGAPNRRTTITFFWMSKNLNREMTAEHSVTWAQMEIAG